jgi:predicted amidohydrolase
MKVCVIQPYYSANFSEIDKCFSALLSHLDKCDDSLDVIVIPEYSDVVAVTPDKETFVSMVEKYSPIIDKKVRETAIRCKATVFANYGYKTENGYRNTTHVIDKNGETVGRYFKMHPAPSELSNDGIDTEYSNYPQDIYTVTVDGVKYAFRTCYDFYFYEDIIEIARQNPDIIIGCSYQRTDTHSALEILNKFLCYNSNAYLVRASVSLGEDSLVGGSSMVVAPDGEVLLNLKNEIGLGIVEIDPSKKYYKSAGFGGKQTSHPEYVDVGRRK